MQYIVGIIILVLISGLRVIKEYKRSVVFTLGKFSGVLQPGLRLIIPGIQTTISIDIREKAVDVPSQEAMTKDNIPCRINAVIYYKIKSEEVENAIINVRNLDYAMSQFAQTTMRNIVGQYELDELLANRDVVGIKIKKAVDEKSDSWAVDVMSVEIKDINIPDDLKRTISKQAEAEREKRAKIITSQGEVESAQNLHEAAKVLSASPGAFTFENIAVN